METIFPPIKNIQSKEFTIYELYLQFVSFLYFDSTYSIPLL